MERECVSIMSILTQHFQTTLNMKNTKRSIHQAHDNGGPRQIYVQTVFIYCKCWVGPGGETHLLPKSDGYSQMVSGFASQDLGVDLLLNEEELGKVTKQRMSQEWCHYLPTDESMTVYDTTKKNNTPTYLGTIFYVGVNLGGFWNYDQISLQVEDVYNFSATMYPSYDFLLLLDQSSGHGKMREGALNVNTMGVRWGMAVNKNL